MGSITEIDRRPRPHVALLAFPFGTHAAPLFALASALAAAAPRAALSFFGSARSNAPLRAAAPPNLRLYDVPDGCPGEPDAPPLAPPEEVRRFLELTPENFQAALAEAEAEAGPVSCVASDAFLWFAAELAAEAGAPWVSLFTGGPAGLCAHLYTDLLRARIGTGEQVFLGENEHLSFIPGLSATRVRDLPEGVVFGDLGSAFARLLHRMAGELPRAAAVVLNTFEGLDPLLDADFKAKFKNLFFLGPLHLVFPHTSTPGLDEHSCLSWLDHRDAATVVYISFGSLMLPTQEELRGMAEGLEESGVPFLWSLKERAREHLPAGFLERTKGQGLVVAWAPQVQVLGHSAVGSFMTHCGWNSIMESISSGVPMICRPFLGDQRMNARMISHGWKVGVGFEGGIVTKDSMISALNMVLKSEEGKKMKARVCELKMQAVQAASPSGSLVENFNNLVKILTGC